MKTVKEHLEDKFLNQRVKIILGHPSNDQHITAIVTGFESGKPPFEEGKVFILLRDVVGNSKSLDPQVKAGSYNKHYFRLNDEIEILKRDENLNKLLE